MALFFKKLFVPQLLANASATLFTVDASPTTTLLRNGRVRLTNTDSSPHTVTLNSVPSGGSASITNQFFPAQSIAPNRFVDVDVPQMSAGDFIAGFADTANLVNIQALDGVLQS